MFSLGISEILLVGLIALIFLGPEQLPEIAKTVARLINEWKRATSDLTSTLGNTIKEDVVNHMEAKRIEKGEEAQAPASTAAVVPAEPTTENTPSIEQEPPKHES